MPEKYLSREKENFFIRSLKGAGFWLVGEFMCFFVCTALLVLMKSFMLLKFFVAFCTAFITLGLMFNWAHNAAKRDRNAVKYHNMQYDKFMPLKMSITAPVISYIMLALLYLCKLGYIHEAYFSLYIICNIWILPYITLFTLERTMSAVSWWGMAGITFLTLLQPLTIYLTYILTYNDVDVVKLIFYPKDKSK